MIAGLVAALLAAMGATGSCPTPATPAPVEHVVHAQDVHGMDIPAGDILTIRWDGADPTDEHYYRSECDAMGGTYMVRLLNNRMAATCHNVNH